MTAFWVAMQVVIFLWAGLFLTWMGWVVRSESRRRKLARRTAVELPRPPAPAVPAVAVLPAPPVSSEVWTELLQGAGLLIAASREDSERLRERHEPAHPRRLRCWMCGAEARWVRRIRVRGETDRIEPGWPSVADHVHAADPPTPEQLLREGEELARRLYARAYLDED